VSFLSNNSTTNNAKPHFILHVPFEANPKPYY
jgi:hypothetical protein